MCALPDAKTGVQLVAIGNESCGRLKVELGNEVGRTGDWRKLVEDVPAQCVLISRGNFINIAMGPDRRLSKQILGQGSVRSSSPDVGRVRQ